MGGASTEAREKEIEGVRMDIGGGGPDDEDIDQNLGFKPFSVLDCKICTITAME